MNYLNEMDRLLRNFKNTPSDDNYKAIEELMTKYKENPPDIIKDNLLNDNTRISDFNPGFLKPDILVKSLSNFMAYPSDENSKAYLTALKEYQTRSDDF
jgi:hypothetical protein